MSESDSKSNELEELNWLVHRPQFQLRSLPIRHRWEVTRRHPYYQLWWKWAHDHFARTADDEAEQYVSMAATLILSAIGVSGKPPDPSTEFEQLGQQELNMAWLSGAVHPITMRGLASLLISALPRETLGHLGYQFLQAACEDQENKPPKKFTAIFELGSLDMPGLDEFSSEPIVSVNPAASGRQIEEAISQLLSQWKAERNLGEKRDRSDKFDEYLKVWDLREGWRNGTYDRSQEKTLREVAETLKVGLQTVHNHYQRAFELIVGHPYSPNLWCQLFGIIKLSDLFGLEPGSVSRRRPLTSRSRRDVPDSVVGKPGKNLRQSPVVLGSAVTADIDVTELVTDILNLIAENRSNEEIVSQLGLSPKMAAAVECLRRHPELISREK